MKRLLPLIILLIVLKTGFSQLSFDNKYEIGIFVGINNVRFQNGHIVDYLIPKDHRLRPTVGLSLRRNLRPHLFLKYESSFSAEGGGFITRRTNLNFIKNQVSIGYTTVSSRMNRYQIGISYSLNFLLNASYRNVNDEKLNIRTYYKWAYHGLGIDLGYSRKFKDTNLVSLNMSPQLFSSALFTPPVMKSRQLLFPRLTIGYAKNIN